MRPSAWRDYPDCAHFEDGDRALVRLANGWIELVRVHKYGVTVILEALHGQKVRSEPLAMTRVPESDDECWATWQSEDAISLVGTQVLILFDNGDVMGSQLRIEGNGTLDYRLDEGGAHSHDPVAVMAVPD